MKNNVFIVFLILAMFLLAGCAAGPNPATGTVDFDGETAGFWLGLWHGCISCITFIISLFNDKVGVYEVYNNGGWYNFGFILGIMIAYGGSGSGACKKKKW